MSRSLSAVRKRYPKAVYAGQHTVSAITSAMIRSGFLRERQRQQRLAFGEAKIAFDMHLAFVTFQALLG